MPRPALPIAALAVLLAAGALDASQPRETANGELFELDGVRVLRVRGDPAQRGRAQGELAGREIVDLINAFLDAGFGKIVDKKVLPALDSAFTWPAHIDAELEGVIGGIEASLGPDERTINFFGRPLSKRDLLAFNAVGDWLPFACSTFTVFAENGPICARNFDYVLPPRALKHQMIVAHEAWGERKAFFTVGFPGLVGVITFVNSDRVFGAIHDVGVKPPGITSGNTPRLVTLRLIAEQAGGRAAVQTALRICRENRTLYGNIFHVASTFEGVPDAAVIEYDFDQSRDGGATLREMDPRLGAIWNTNHFRARSEPERCGRYVALAAALDSAMGTGFDLEAARAVIARSTVCITMHQALIDLDARRMMLALQDKIGVPANRNRFSRIGWDGVFAAKQQGRGEEEGF